MNKSVNETAGIRNADELSKFRRVQVEISVPELDGRTLVSVSLSNTLVGRRTNCLPSAFLITS